MLPSTRETREFKARQKKTALADRLLKNREANEPLFKGSPDAPLVQRVGACIFGISFVLAGVRFLVLGFDKGSWPVGVFSIGWLLLGGRLFQNAFRRHRVKSIHSD